MATDEKKEILRTKHFTESFDMAKKMRHGVFTMPISTAIGDNNYFPTKKARRDETGAVITDPINFLTKKAKKGQGVEVTFGKPAFVTVGDPYNSSAG